MLLEPLPWKLTPSWVRYVSTLSGGVYVLTSLVAAEDSDGVAMVGGGWARGRSRIRLLEDGPGSVRRCFGARGAEPDAALFPRAWTVGLSMTRGVGGATWNK